MATKKTRIKTKGYSLMEIKNKYLPKRDMATLENPEATLSEAAIMDILKRSNQPKPRKKKVAVKLTE